MQGDAHAGELLVQQAGHAGAVIVRGIEGAKGAQAQVFGDEAHQTVDLVLGAGEEAPGPHAFVTGQQAGHEGEEDALFQHAGRLDLLEDGGLQGAAHHDAIGGQGGKLGVPVGLAGIHHMQLCQQAAGLEFAQGDLGAVADLGGNAGIGAAAGQGQGDMGPRGRGGLGSRSLAGSGGGELAGAERQHQEQQDGEKNAGRAAVFHGSTGLKGCVVSGRGTGRDRMAGDGMPQAGGMADMLPGTGRAGAAFPGKSGIIARSATWRKGREGGARGRERGRDKKTRRAQGLDWSGARRGCACGRHKYGTSGVPEGGPFSNPESYAAKRIFCKDASWQEISLPCQSIARQWQAVRPGPFQPACGSMPHAL